VSRLQTRLAKLERSPGLPKPPQPVTPAGMRWQTFMESHPNWPKLEKLIAERWPNDDAHPADVFADNQCWEVFVVIDDEFWMQEHALRRTRGVSCDCHLLDHPGCAD